MIHDPDHLANHHLPDLLPDHDPGPGEPDEGDPGGCAAAHGRRRGLGRRVGEWHVINSEPKLFRAELEILKKIGLSTSQSGFKHLSQAELEKKIRAELQHSC